MQMCYSVTPNDLIDTLMHLNIYLTVLIALHAFHLLQRRFLSLEPPSLITRTICNHHCNRQHLTYQIIQNTHLSNNLFTLIWPSRWCQLHYTNAITSRGSNLQEVMLENLISVTLKTNVHRQKATTKIKINNNNNKRINTITIVL